MILTITRYTTRLALRIKSLLDRAQLTDWRQLQLVIDRPRECACSKHVPGSPWILTGCWPFHPTGVDLANPCLPDFPAIVIDAFDSDDEGRVVFILDERIHSLPSARYSGTLRVHPHQLPINVAADLARHKECRPWGQNGAMIRYDTNKRLQVCTPTHAVPCPPRHVCELAHFDIDLGPECAQHMIDQAVVEFANGGCGDDL